MIWHWFGYAVGIALLFGLAAAALEHLLRLHRQPARAVWVAALAGSALVPAALLLRPVPSAEIVGVMEQFGEGNVLMLPILATVPDLPAEPIARVDMQRLDGWLFGVWEVLSGALVLMLALSALRTAWRRRTWEHATVAGERVRITKGTGPAVAGFVRPEIVLPGWVLEWSEKRQGMIVEHEREHIPAHDPLLLLGALVALVLLPWNPALWWQVKRLRRAIKIDCDARVLRGHREIREYGALLLEVGRLAASGPLPVAAFSEPASLLESRIRWMVAQPPRRR